MIIRDEDGIRAWELGDVQFCIFEKTRLVHILYADKLNVSIPLDSFTFHAGTVRLFAQALSALSDVEPSDIIADFTAMSST